MIYLDYSANTPADPAVLEAFCQTERMFIGKPNSTRPAGQAAQAEMARVTDGVGTLYLEKDVRDVYAFGPVEGREAILLFNEQTVLTADKTVEYII